MKYTNDQILRAAKKAAKAFQIWNTSNQGASPKEQLMLGHKKDQAVVSLLNKMGAWPSKEKSYKEVQ